MTAPVIKIKVQPKPLIRVKVIPRPVIKGKMTAQIPAQVSVDSVTTGAPGTDASVVNVGTPGNARLQFTIPRGADGSPGNPGADGADGVVQSLVAGSNITIDATDPANPIINSTASGDGDVVGPASSVDSTPAVFDGTTGKLLKNITYAAFKTLLSLVKGDVGLGNVDNTSDATKNSATATLTNKTLTSPVINGATGSAASSFTATTQSARDNSTKLATTAYVDGATRERLTANRTYYVSTTGSDSNNGLSSGAPFLTVAKALSVILGTLDVSGFTVTIQLADGTYSVTSIVIGSGVGIVAPTNLVIRGNNTTPSNVKIAGSDYTFRAESFGAICTVLDMELSSTAGRIFSVGGGGQIYYGNVVFGNPSATGEDITVLSGGYVQATSSYSTYTNKGCHINVAGGQARVTGITVTITGTPSFATSFVKAYRGGVLVIFSNTYTGSATGPRFSVYGNGLIDTNGLATTGLPGNSSPSTPYPSGGQYL